MRSFRYYLNPPERLPTASQPFSQGMLCRFYRLASIRLGNLLIPTATYASRVCWVFFSIDTQGLIVPLVLSHNSVFWTSLVFGLSPARRRPLQRRPWAQGRLTGTGCSWARMLTMYVPRPAASGSPRRQQLPTMHCAVRSLFCLLCCHLFHQLDSFFPGQRSAHCPQIVVSVGFVSCI
ncbi:hypothetical protein BDZ89DRAFT_680397 [Hymenopellis radicata]|nr:hypothetical protein BDZ89DRAFT_680397 [Hymenopellis radicata]